MVHTFFPLPGRRWRMPAAVGILSLAVALALGGCASVPPPDAAMNQAQMQLQAARDAGAADYDPVDLGFAQDKFQQAQVAMSDRKYAQAADLADESRADAMLARTKSQLAAVRAQIQSKVEDNNQLRSQNEQAQADADQQQAQHKAQLAAALQQADGSAPAGASSAPAPASSANLPMQAPTQDMPAPSASVLAPPSGQGFQTVPAPAQSTQGGQP